MMEWGRGQRSETRENVVIQSVGTGGWQSAVGVLLVGEGLKGG